MHDRATILYPWVRVTRARRPLVLFSPPPDALKLGESELDLQEKRQALAVVRAGTLVDGNLAHCAKSVVETMELVRRTKTSQSQT